MAKISTYPDTPPPALDDFLLGTDVSNSDATQNFLVSDLLNLSRIPNLQEVTSIGSTTTNIITANGFIKIGGLSNQFLKANGSLDNNTYALASDIPVIPYKVYTALLSQSGTSAPTIVVLQNTLGDNLTATYNTIGTYSLTLNTLNLFLSQKTFILLNSSYNSNAYLGIVRGNNNQLLITATYNGSNSDNVISNASIEIRVYN